MAREQHINQEINFWVGILKNFVGWTIHRPLYSIEDDEVWVGFQIRSPDGKKLKDVWFLSDEEGNHGGRFNAAELIKEN